MFVLDVPSSFCVSSFFLLIRLMMITDFDDGHLFSHGQGVLGTMLEIIPVNEAIEQVFISACWIWN